MDLTVRGTYMTCIRVTIYGGALFILKASLKFRGTHPMFTKITQNLVHELGAFEKQSSHVFQAKSCFTIIEGNAFFNGPRAGINFNDGYCGGHIVRNNAVWNTCRESGDHGNMQFWIRRM